MGKISSIRQDPEKCQKGVLFEFNAGIKLRIARYNNPTFKKVVADLSKDKLAALRAGDPEVTAAVNREAAAKALLIGWENIEDDGGYAIPYSPEKALEFLSDPTMQDLYDFVIASSMSQEAFRVESLGN